MGGAAFSPSTGGFAGGNRRESLACLLASIGFENDALDIATGYFCEDGDERTKATALLRRLNITDDAINAQASQLNLPILSMLERLMANRQSRRDVILSEYHRRKADNWPTNCPRPNLSASRSAITPARH